MRKGTGFIVVSGLLAGLACLAPEARSQEPPAGPTTASGADQEQGQPKKKNFGLYVGVAGGIASVEEFDTSVTNRSFIDDTTSAFELPDQLQARASVGWQLSEGRGDFRLNYKGYTEDKYEFTSTGNSAKVKRLDSAQQDVVVVPGETIDWWQLSINDGRLSATRTPRSWSLAMDDANGNGLPDPDEVRRGDPDRVVELDVPSNLRNQFQTIDALFGREFGGRRFSSHWWGGLRYFKYSGQVLAGTWLVPQTGIEVGTGWTDGSFLKLLLMEQESSGWGPTGAWEVDFNFFNKGLVLFVQLQAAFVFSKIEVDTGPFFALTQALNNAVAIPARLNESRDKSTWQNTVEAGARVQLRNGLRLELGWSFTGYLDALITPQTILLPESEDQRDAVTALYGTQDYRVGGWHAGVAFQF